jgi:ATP-dependent Clp protease adapter protein ClpS
MIGTASNDRAESIIVQAHRSGVAVTRHLTPSDVG